MGRATRQPRKQQKVAEVPARRPWLPGIAMIFLLACAATAFIQWRRISTEIGEPVDLSRVPYVRSIRCLGCHTDRHASWYRTHHRRMTQPANRESVLGNFENQSYRYAGIDSRFFRDGGRYLIETMNGEGARETFQIEKTVGSRRVQQYVARTGDRHIRLPLAWNILEKRWFHLNGGFLHPDGSNFNEHTALWDANCIFCHNVKAQPGLDLEDGTFDSSVAEMGIACEACHGPGGEHVTRNSSWLRSEYLKLSGRPDPTIVSPSLLSKEKRLQICGHCHGQRLPNPPERIKELMTLGDPYTAGEDLSRYTQPIWRDSQLKGVDLSLRFWRDGTPRLTAYEYQGILMSPDFQKGELTCISCHDMHGGDPNGMIQPAKRGPAACVGCHAEIVRRSSEHSKHKPESSGNNCYDCHMPKIAYGILDVHPTHRIQKPDPSRAWRYEMPEACTLCHSNRSAAWAAAALVRQGTRLEQTVPPGDPPAFRIAENIRALLSGDVVQRSVAIMALSRSATYTTSGRERLWTIPFLLIGLQDNYPAIRGFAFRGLRAVTAAAPDLIPAPPAGPFDPLADEEVRLATSRRWAEWWKALDKKTIPHPGEAVPLDSALMPVESITAPLISSRSREVISIGE